MFSFATSCENKPNRSAFVMKLKHLALLIAFLASSTTSRNATRENILEELNYNCTVENNADPQNATYYESPENQAYMLCVHRGLGWIDQDDSLVPQKIFDFYEDDTKLSRKIFENCLARYADDLEVGERAYKIQMCMEPHRNYTDQSFLEKLDRKCYIDTSNFVRQEPYFESEEYKRYLLCMYRGVGIVDKSGNFNSTSYLEFYEDDADDIMARCAEIYSDEKDLTDKVFYVDRCVNEDEKRAAENI